MSYTRVIPRDLFNESKLLKCYGQLSLLIHEGRTRVPLMIQHDDSADGGFVIQQDGDRAMIYCDNLLLCIDNERETIPLRVGNPINSREPYPMELYTDDESVIEVFHKNGNLTTDFINYCKGQCDAQD